jgi:uncharacterized protein YegL
VKNSSLIPWSPPNARNVPQTKRGALSLVLDQLLVGNRPRGLTVKSSWNETENPATRSPGCFICDASGSMAGEAIYSLNEGMSNLASIVREDLLTAICSEFAIIRVGGEPELIMPFTVGCEFYPKKLYARGGTPLVEALLMGIETTEARLQTINRYDLDAHKPLVIVISDGGAGQSMYTKQAINEIRRVEKNNIMAVFGVGTDKEATRLLQKYLVRPAVTISHMNFNMFFRKVSQHMINVSRTSPGDEMDFDLGDEDWAE